MNCNHPPRSAVGEPLALLARMVLLLLTFGLSASCNQDPADGPGTRDASLTWVKKTSDRRLLVFVHGLSGDSKATWTAQNGAYWPTLITEGNEAFGTDVVVYDYFGTLFDGNMNVTRLASQFASVLREDPLLYDAASSTWRYSEMVILGHSMGNLIARTALAQHASLQTLKVPIFIAIAAPAGGVDLARASRLLPVNTAINDMMPDSTLLDSIAFLDRHKETRTVCGYETAPDAELGAVVVPKASAVAWCPNGETQRGFERDHSSIVKPEGPDAEVYRWVQFVLRKTPPAVDLDQLQAELAAAVEKMVGQNYLIERNGKITLQDFSSPVLEHLSSVVARMEPHLDQLPEVERLAVDRARGLVALSKRDYTKVKSIFSEASIVAAEKQRDELQLHVGQSRLVLLQVALLEGDEKAAEELLNKLLSQVTGSEIMNAMDAYVVNLAIAFHGRLGARARERGDEARAAVEYAQAVLLHISHAQTDLQNLSFCGARGVDGAPEPWVFHPVVGDPDVARHETAVGDCSLSLRCKDACYKLAQAGRHNVASTAWLRWRWSARTLPGGSARDIGCGEEAAAVIVLFQHGPFKFRAIHYVWDSLGRRGEVYFHSEAVASGMIDIQLDYPLVVVSDADDVASGAVEVARNVHDDYRMIYGETPPDAYMVAVQACCQYFGSDSDAQIAGLSWVENRPSGVRVDRLRLRRKYRSARRCP